MLEEASVAAFEIPTETPEADGTLRWSSTTLVVVELRSGQNRGFGYTYTHSSAAHLLASSMLPDLMGCDVFNFGPARELIVRGLRNFGTSGIAATALSALDCALWDLKCKALDLPMTRLLRTFRDSVPAYGSGGFTNFTDDELRAHCSDWLDRGLTKIKMKVGAESHRDRHRVSLVRRTLGNEPELFVDANGGYDVEEALAHAEAFRDEGVTWFEEPVSSDDLRGLREIRRRSPRGLEITAGEYGFDLEHFKGLVMNEAVDVLQPDATRCGGVSGFLEVANLARAHHLPVSSHCAPTLHLSLGCACETFRHLEIFYDHMRIESLLFDGFQMPEDGFVSADPSRPGFGVEFKWRDAERFLIPGSDANFRVSNLPPYVAPERDKHGVRAMSHST